MQKFTVVAALMISAAAPAMALEFGPGFYANGKFALEYLDSGSSSGSTFGFADADIGYEQEGGGFGAFVGLLGFQSEGESVTSLYGAISYSGDFGKIQIGAPRNAIDDYFKTPDIGGSSLLGLEVGQLSGSILPLAALQSDETPLGLRYDGSFGAIKLGVSYHVIDDLDVVVVAMNYQLGETVLRAGAENLSGDGFSETSYFLGAEGKLGPVTGGIVFADLGVIGVTSTQVYAVYSPIEALDLTATYLAIKPEGGSTQDGYGLDAKYTFNPGVYVGAGYLGNLFGSSSDAYTLALGIEF